MLLSEIKEMKKIQEEENNKINKEIIDDLKLTYEDIRNLMFMLRPSARFNESEGQTFDKIISFIE